MDSICISVTKDEESSSLLAEVMPQIGWVRRRIQKIVERNPRPHEFDFALHMGRITYSRRIWGSEFYDGIWGGMLEAMREITSEVIRIVRESNPRAKAFSPELILDVIKKEPRLKSAGFFSTIRQLVADKYYWVCFDGRKKAITLSGRTGCHSLIWAWYTQVVGDRKFYAQAHSIEEMAEQMGVGRELLLTIEDAAMNPSTSHHSLRRVMIERFGLEQEKRVCQRGHQHNCTLPVTLKATNSSATVDIASERRA